MMGRYRKKPGVALLSLRILPAVLVMLGSPGLSHRSWAGDMESTLYVAAQGGHLSIKVSDVPLDKVLEEIARQTEIRFYGDSRITQKKISEEFEDLPMVAGLERLLNGFNYGLVFTGKAGGDPSLRPGLTAVSIFPRGEKMASGPKEADQALDQVALSSEGRDRPDPSDRPKAVESIGKHPDQTIIPGILNSLQDPDRAIRLSAIESLSRWGPLVPMDSLVEMGLGNEDPQTRLAVLASGLPLPREVLVNSALHDSSPLVRHEALFQVSIRGTGSDEVAKEALNDPDPSVQALAQEMLKRPSVESDRVAENDPAMGELPPIDYDPFLLDAPTIP